MTKTQAEQTVEKTRSTESTTSQDVGGLTGLTTPKPEGMTDEEWQDVQRRQQGVEDTPDSGTAQPR